MINTASSATINAVRVADAATSDTNSRVAILKNTDTSATGTRRAIRFIEGTNVSLTINDDSSNEEVEVTIASTGGSGGGVSLGLALALG